jgi:hypothetical protein
MTRDNHAAAAATYASFRGLLQIPAGALIVLAALGNWEVGPFRHTWVFPVCVVLLGAAWLPIQRHYQEHYGRIEVSARQQAKTVAALGIAVVVVIVGSLLLRSRASWSLDLPVNPIAITFAVVMLVSHLLGAGVRTHHVVIWGALLVAGALPGWDGEDPSNVGLVLAGVAVMLSGLLDHRQLVHSFGRADALDPGGSGA